MKRHKSGRNNKHSGCNSKHSGRKTKHSGRKLTTVVGKPNTVVGKPNRWSDTRTLLGHVADSSGQVSSTLGQGTETKLSKNRINHANDPPLRVSIQYGLYRACTAYLCNVVYTRNMNRLVVTYPFDVVDE